MEEPLRIRIPYLEETIEYDEFSNEWRTDGGQFSAASLSAVKDKIKAAQKKEFKRYSVYLVPGADYRSVELVEVTSQNGAITWVKNERGQRKKLDESDTFVKVSDSTTKIYNELLALDQEWEKAIADNRDKRKEIRERLKAARGK